MTHILVFGDSTTYGCWDKQGGWVQRIRAKLDKKNSTMGKQCILVYNLGISGDTTTGYVKRFQNEVPIRLDKEEENIFIISGGGNDTLYMPKKKKHWVSLKKYKQNIRTLIKMARRHSNKIVFTGLSPADQTKVDPIPWHKNGAYRNTYIARYNEAMKKICAEEKVPFLNFYSKLNNKTFISTLKDGVHPLDKGHGMMERIVWSFLKKK
jgi:lysophospholipase L1-like esterase